MAERNATPMPGSVAARMDGCTSCVVNAEVPYAGFTKPSGADVCMYLCTDCGHRWHTEWAGDR